MAKRESNRLEPVVMTRLIKDKLAGRHPDGWGLYLVIEANGAARWAFLYRERGTGRRREMGLGSATVVSLKKARDKAAAARLLLDANTDPIAAKQAEAAILTFGEMADIVLAKKQAEFRSETAAARAKRALEHYCEPIRPLQVNKINTEAVLSILKPIWSEKPETARKVRGLIEAVLNAAKAKGMRAGENPAAWKGHLDHLLERKKKDETQHHAAMPRKALPDFVADLRTRDATAARALEFQILTAARPGEVLGAVWGEIDLAAKVWCIPADRMKAEREHRVPLSARAVEIVEEMAKFKDGDFVFPGGRKHRPMSGAAFERLLTRMKVTDATPHGFRSTFRDWAGEVSTFPRELAEAALAHAVGDATERAYARGDALDKRRKLMTAWAGFCAPAKGNVTNIRRVE